MAYRTLLVHLVREGDADDVLPVAIELAERHGAHLTGLHVLPPLDPIGYYSVGVPLPPNESWERERRELAERLRSCFETATRAVDFVAEWRVVDAPFSSVDRSVSAMANTGDLLLTGLDPAPAHRAGRGELAGRILLGCARPVMLVPPGRSDASVARRVFVAWDGQRASTRAVFGALPLMRRADVVRLQRMNLPAGERHRAGGATEDLANALSRHGVEIEVHAADASESEIGSELVGFARDWGADLIVAGGYERSAFRESLFGSTTRYLLQHAEVPLLMSV